MSSPASQTQWYLARDGQQYGPLSEVELGKFIELGHLQPTDLLWREGFTDWRPALVVFPPRKPPAARPSAQVHFPPPPNPLFHPPAPQRGPREQPVTRPGPMQRGGGTAARAGPTPREARMQPDEEARPGRLRRTFVVLVCLALVGAGAWYGYPKRKLIMEQLKSLPSLVPAGLFDLGSGKTSSDRRNLETSPLMGFSSAPEAVDAALQATPLWRIIKREFPDWYADRLREAAGLAGQSKDEAGIAQHLARALVSLRRQNANHALAADFPYLKAVAKSFFGNVAELRRQSPAACYEFISQGEASPTVISLLRDPAHTAHFQAQLTDVFEAIAAGRKTPRAYPQPRKSDYDALQADLMKRGWSQADLQLFSDERALSRAGPEKVCQLVHDWFAAQLSMQDPDVQLRLLIDSLKPVVAG